MRGYSPFGSAGFSTQDTPFTWGIIAANFIALVLLTFRLLDPSWLTLTVPGALARPWTLLTYPLVSFNIIGMLFYGLWLYFIGSALERAWGTFTYVLFFVLVTMVSGISLEIGASLTHIGFRVENWLPLAAVTVAFCQLMPYETILLIFVPVQARILGWIEIVILFFLYAGRSPLLGIFALAGCGVAWLWVNKRWMDTAGRPRWRGPSGAPPLRPFRPVDQRTWKEKINPIEIWKRYKRRKQFDRLMKGD